MNLPGQLGKNCLFNPARLVFAGETPKSAEVVAQKTETKEAEAKPTLEQKAASYSMEDLKRSRDDAFNVLEDKIKHPDVVEEARKELADKLQPLEEQLARLTEEETQARLNIKYQLEKAVTEIISAQRQFKDITIKAPETEISGIKMSEFIFKIDPPRPIEEYNALKEMAAKTIDTLTHWNWNGVIEDAPTLINGTARMKVILSDEASKAKEGYKNILIKGDKVTQKFSDKQTDEAIADTASLQTEFEKWKKGGEANFHYGKPKKVFPPAGVDIDDFLNTYKISRVELTLDALMRNGNEDFKDLSAPLHALDDIKQKETVSIIKNKDGKYFKTVNVEKITSLLSNEEKITEKRGETLKETLTGYEIVNQERRKVAIVIEYWPAEPGREHVLKKTEKYSDGVIISESIFDREGKLLEVRSRVNGCDGIEAVDRPVGPPYREIARLGRYGEKLKDKNGNIITEREVTRVFTIKDENGKEKVAIRSMKDENAMRLKQGLKPIDQEAYIKQLAGKLQTPQEMHAFLNLMFKYKYDIGEHWQDYAETAGRINNGRMLGDCEDYAFFMEKLLREQGKNARVLSLPGHAECIIVEQNEKGRYHAISYGTFGVDMDGNRIGEKLDGKKTEGYGTAEEALKSLQSKWHVKSSGNPEMGTGDLTELAASEFLGKKLSVMSIETNFNKITKFIGTLNNKSPSVKVDNIEYTVNEAGLIIGKENGFTVAYKKLDGAEPGQYQIGKYTLLDIKDVTK